MMVKTMNFSFFESPQLWIATLALIFSQLPPLRDLVRGTKICINTKEQITLTTFLGRLDAGIFLDIHNTGGKAVSIAKIDCIIQKDKDHVWNLPARTYFLGQNEFLLGGISLKPGEHWSNSIRCYDLLEEEEEEEVYTIVSKFSAWQNRNSVNTTPTATNPFETEASAELVNSATNFFKKHFNLRRGNYQLFITALSESNKILCVKGFSFILFDSYIHTLQADTDEYKYGKGILSYSTPIYPRLHPLEDDDAQKIYQKLHHSLIGE